MGGAEHVELALAFAELFEFAGVALVGVFFADLSFEAFFEDFIE